MRLSVVAAAPLSAGVNFGQQFNYIAGAELQLYAFFNFYTQ